MTTTSSRFAVTCVAALFIVLIAAAGVDAASCSCANGGSIVTSTPCVCSCPAAFAQPTCAWRNDAYVDVIVVFQNTSANAGGVFVTSTKTEAILAHYRPTYTSSEPLPYKVLRRRVSVEPADLSELHVIFRVRGDLVYAMLVDGDAGPAPWMRDIDILRVTLYILDPSAPGSLAGSPTVFSFAVMNTTVPVPYGAIAWPLGAFITLVLVPLSEAVLGALCFHGEVDEEDLAPDAVSPQAHSD